MTYHHWVVLMALAVLVPASCAVADTSDPHFQGTTPPPALRKAIDAEQKGNFDGAISLYRGLLSVTHPVEVRQPALWRLARLHDRLDQHRESLPLYELLLALPLAPDDEGEVVFRLGWAYATVGNSSQAKAQFQKLLNNFPQNPQTPRAAYWLAVHTADEKDNALAHHYVDWLLNHLRECRTNPGNNRSNDLLEQALCLKCMLLARSELWAEIEFLLREEFVTRGREEGDCEAPMHPRLAYWQAEAEFRQRHFVVAEEMFEQLATRLAGVHEPWVPMVPLRRAQLAARQMQWSQVLDYVTKIETKFPEFELQFEVDYLRGRALAGQGEMHRARQSYQRAIDHPLAANSETAAMAQWMIGESYFHQENYTLAKAAYGRVIEHHDFPQWKARAALQAGKCAEREQRWEEAQRLYSEALKSPQRTDSHDELESRLRWAESRSPAFQ